jgi:hypothetical protein
MLKMNLRKNTRKHTKSTQKSKMSKAPPPTLEGLINPHSPEQMMAPITELHSELTAQRARIAQLTNPQAALAPASASASASAPPSAILKKNKPPTFDGKSTQDSWIAHMTSYIHAPVADNRKGILRNHRGLRSPRLAPSKS